MKNIKKAVIVPDSFKGTMTSKRICEIVKNAIREVFPDANTVSIPVADGGEGSADAFLSAIGGEKRFLKVKGPYFEDIDGYYAVLNDGETAVIEMAVCAGLPLVGERKNPALTTTYGVGQLMADAVQRGSKKIILCLGGSATNDAGCGAAAALGVSFCDKDGNIFIPTGGTLSNVYSIDSLMTSKLLYGIETVAMCDVDNPLCGEKGAAYVFAPQKGADCCQVKMLDNGLKHIESIIGRDVGVDTSVIAGAGAAGGMGAGAAAFFGAKLKSGIDTVLDAVGFDELLDGADIVITGEGKIDRQSLDGKVISGVARRASGAGIPVIAVVGDIGEGAEEFYDRGVSGIFSINKLALPYKQAKETAENDLYFTVKNIMNFISKT